MHNLGGGRGGKQRVIFYFLRWPIPRIQSCNVVIRRREVVCVLGICVGFSDYLLPENIAIRRNFVGCSDPMALTVQKLLFKLI